MTVRTRLQTTGVSRRQLLGSLVSAGGLAIGGGLLLAAGTQRASASIETNTLSIPDATHSDPAATPVAAFALVTGTLSWESQDTLPDGYTVALDLALSQSSADAGDYSRIGTTSGRLMTYSGSASYEVRGDLTAHPNLAAEDPAAPDAGTTTSVDLWLRAVGKIQRGEKTLATAMATDTATLTVSNTSVAITAGISGDGSLAVQGDSDDPTPTVA